jgi:hypothetical protein
MDNAKKNISFKISLSTIQIVAFPAKYWTGEKSKRKSNSRRDNRFNNRMHDFLLGKKPRTCVKVPTERAMQTASP